MVVVLVVVVVVVVEVVIPVPVAVTMVLSSALPTARPALRGSLRCPRGRSSPHLPVPEPSDRGGPDVWPVSTRNPHDRALHRLHGHPVRAVPEGALHRAVELPAPVSVLRQLLQRQPGGGDRVLTGQQPGVSVQGGLLLDQRLLRATLGVRARGWRANPRWDPYGGRESSTHCKLRTSPIDDTCAAKSHNTSLTQKSHLRKRQQQKWWTRL